MEIVEIIPPYLYSVKYDDEQLDEYHRVFRDWHEKLADTIQNSPVLNKEVFKRIDQTLAYMKREGITEQEDL